MPAGRLTSFVGGMEELVRALVEPLGSGLHLDTPVRCIRGRGPYTLDIGGAAPVTADAVVLCGPATETAGIVEELDRTLAGELRGIRRAPLAVVCLGYDEAAVRGAGVPLDGFGFLVPRGEGVRILGSVWDSSVYAGRAPDGRMLVRAMFGGATDPEAVEIADEELTRIVRADLCRTMRLDIAPAFCRIYRHTGGIPQYTLGHLDRLARIERRLEGLPGLFLAGNAYRGVAMNACVTDARAVAERVATYVRVLHTDGVTSRSGLASSHAASAAVVS